MYKDWIFHDSQDLAYRSPFGAVPCAAEVTLRLEIIEQVVPDVVLLRLWKNKAEEKIVMHRLEERDGRVIYQGKITMPSTPGLLWYYFIISLGNKQLQYYGNNSSGLGGIGRIYDQDPPAYQITVYKRELRVPSWFREAVMYQIFVDRFYNGCAEGSFLNPKPNAYLHASWDDLPFYLEHPYTGKVIVYDFFGGNLAGIIEKLPYLKELGVNVLYLNPVFEAASNHKYDTGDYKKIDPMFGNNQLFRELCAKAREHGIAIILDGVFSHTGSDSIYFNKEGRYPGLGAYQSRESPYYRWYRFSEFPDSYECWWDVDTLPNVEEMEPSYLDFIILGENSVLRYWLGQGAKGWRLDVADELPDEFIKQFRRVMKEEDPESVLIGEVWEDASNKVSYGQQREYLWGEELDSVMNYPFRQNVIDFILGTKDAALVNRSLLSQYENYPLEHFYSLMNFAGTHDVPRILTILGEAPPEHVLSKKDKAYFTLDPKRKKLAVERLKLFVLLQMTFPGVPCIYYGDEAGMEGYRDPLNRGPYPWGKENGELLSWYKRLILLRRRHDVLKTGLWVPVYASGDVYCYVRKIEQGVDVFGQKRKENTAVVMINRSTDKGVALCLDLSRWCQGELLEVLGSQKPVSLRHGQLEIFLEPLAGKLFMEEVEDEK